jgi:hypothetical protein
MTIFFDLDGCLVDLYSYPNWLPLLQAHDALPYAEAAVMHNMSRLAYYLNKVKAAGYSIGIISWLSKTSTQEYDCAVTAAKLDWLHRHLPSVIWDDINIVSYGMCKADFMTSDNDILFDDEESNRKEWRGVAYEPSQIFDVLKELLTET